MQKLDVPNKRITITLTPDTEERLRKYAVDNHMSVSQAVTQLVWSDPLLPNHRFGKNLKSWRSYKAGPMWNTCMTRAAGYSSG